MLIRRTVAKTEATQVDQLINILRFDDARAREQLAQRISSTPLQQYFCNIYKLIDGKNLCHYKAYQCLPDGLYILLKGEVRFLGSEICQRQKMKKTKGSNFKTCVANISQTWTVFQCSFKNCSTFDDTYLLRITEEQAQQSKFYEFFSHRNQLYSNQYLSQDHQALYPHDAKTAFSAELRIHSNFSFKSYFFREVISLNSPAIISSGRAKLKHSNIQSHEFDRFGVLLPHLKYEVTSSEIEIMVVSPNQTISYNFQQNIEIPHYSACKSAVSSVHKTEVSTPDFTASALSKKQIEKRSKQLGRLIKESVPFSIISGLYCEKSLSYAKRHNALHCTKQKKENRYKHPLVLFNISNEKSKLAIPDFSDLSNTSISHNTNTKYLSSYKSSSTSQFSQSAILRKIKLPPADYDRMLKKHKQKVSLNDLKRGKTMKRAFLATLDGFNNESLREEDDDQYFVPYDKS